MSETEVIEYPFTVRKSYHKKKQIDIWIVKLKKQFRVTRESYNELKSEVKNLNGYYSFYAKGFVFETQPTEEDLEEFAKTIETLLESEKEFTPETVNFNPLSKQTVTNFNFFRMFQYDLNEEFEKNLKAVMEKITELTGLEYSNYTPLIYEAFQKYQKALQEYYQRKSQSNMIFPNPYVTGRSNYKNIERKKQRAFKTEAIGREKLERAEKNLNRAISHYLRYQENHTLPTIDFVKDELNKKIREIRKKYRGKITIRKAYGGSRQGKKYSAYNLVIGEDTFQLTFNENGNFQVFKNYYPVKTYSLESLDEMLKFTEKIIEIMLREA